MKIEKIKALLEAVRDTDIEEISISNGDERAGFKRSVACSPVNTAPVPEKSSSSQEKSAVPLVDMPYGKILHIHSPMVGTFYRNLPASDTQLVKEGDFVSEGQKVGIIEAMRIIKEIDSPMSGKIVKVLIQDAQPVEYGQPIFEVEPQVKSEGN